MRAAGGDEAVRRYDKPLLVLSENSIHSAWVRKEVKTALQEEGRRNATVLFPVRLDDAVMDTTEQWADDLRREFCDLNDKMAASARRNHDVAAGAFERSRGGDGRNLLNESRRAGRQQAGRWGPIIINPTAFTEDLSLGSIPFGRPHVRHGR